MNAKKSVVAAFDFEIDSFGSDPKNPIVLGLFHSDESADRTSIAIRITEPNAVNIVVAGQEGTWASKPGTKLKGKPTYRFTVIQDDSSRVLTAKLTEVGDEGVTCELQGKLPPDVRGLCVNEVGITQTGCLVTETSPREAHTYRIRRIRYMVKVDRSR